MEVRAIQHHTITYDEEFSKDTQCFCKYVYGYSDKFFPHNHTFFELFLVVKGTVEHWVNGEEQKIPEGTLVFIRPDDVHGFLYTNPQNKDNIYINLSFTKETATALFTYLADDTIEETICRGKMPPSILLSTPSKNRLISLLNELNAINKNDIRSLNLRVKTILADIFTQYLENKRESNANDSPQWLIDLLKEMEKIDNFTKGIDRMVELSGKSREHLSRSLKKYCGTTITEYVNKLRINYAANLLINSNMAVIDICYTSGFQNLGYFYKIFKDEYKISPNLFKKRYTKINI